MQSVGLVAYVIVLAALGRWPTFEWELIPYAAVLSVIGIVSLAALYRAFAIGPIAVVSPVVASYAALTVILIVIFLGERLTTGQSIAIGVTFIGVAVASTDIRELRRTLGRPTEGVRIGFFATLGFAVWSAIFAVGVRETDGLALIVVQRAFSVVLLALFVIARGISLASARRTSCLRAHRRRPESSIPARTCCSRSASRSAIASFVMTGSGAYPLIPALLAILVLRERLAPNQYVGVAVLIAGLVALGLQS